MLTKNLRFKFISNLPRKSFSETDFLYKFLNKNKLNTDDRQYLINKSLLNGLSFIYKNFLIALKERDYEFLQSICEVNFFSKLKDNLIDYNQTIYSNYTDENDKTIQIKPESVFLINEVFLSASRAKNKESEAKLDQKVSGKFPSFLFDALRKTSPFNFYSSNPLMNTIVCRVQVDIASNLILTRQLQENSANEREIHNFIIEAEFQDPSHLFQVFDFPAHLKFLFKKKFEKQENQEIDWKVADFDNFMKGNPLI